MIENTPSCFTSTQWKAKKEQHHYRQEFTMPWARKKTTRKFRVQMMSQLVTTAWSLYFTCITQLHSAAPGRTSTQGIQWKVPSQNNRKDSSFNKEFPLVWHFETRHSFICQAALIQAEHGLHTVTPLVERLPSPHLCASRSKWQCEGKQRGKLCWSKWSWASAP